MILLPSRGRPQLLARFFEKSRPSLPGRVLVDDDDKSYAGMPLPRGWSWLIGPRAPLVKIFNRAWESMPGEAWYGMVGDDVVCSPGWDVALAAAAVPNRVAWGDDGINGSTLGTTFFVGGDLARAMGWLQHPALGHLYADTVWNRIATGAGLGVYRADIATTHMRIQDATYRERSKAGDPEAFARIQEQEMAGLIDRARRA